ncbi:LacI family transcriptional regulator [Frondihabitans sp. PAMC 28766]|uniref:LacI family DNA-binding transcriptional regulator n=1 Tax=Frondihabitans sp. PAMC 28766 TaxID=1795630 RepID=UPI00078C72DF|nr:LacI family DNA-binding transcriptional regulator [Frondihabitans sp. PAMC 28766]AMM19400.1 LacI family transcriptional regulator [Frondihabitans sp. PAMC 28766]
MSDVAARAGVSRQLVSMVMRGLPGPSDASQKLILEAAAALDFRPNASARLLRQKRTHLIGVMIQSSNPFELRVVERLLERAAEQGFHMVIGPMSETRTTDVVISELLEQRVEAIACYNPDPASPALSRAFDTIPVAWLGERASDPRADVVRTDDDAGLQLIVDHLVSLGHREIAYAGGLDGTVGPDRADTYRRAMERAGLGSGIDVVEVGFGAEDGATAGRTLLAREQLPTAVVGGSDLAGAGLRAIFAQAGVAVPGDISVTGYDDSDVASLSFNSLTTIRQDVELTVEATLTSLLRRLADPALPAQEVATLATLVVRGSTGPARQA